MLDIAFPIWNACRMLDTANLHVFVRIADSGSLSAAARSLGMPKSSVSRALSRLETAAGAALLERTPQNQRLTDAGRLLLRHARRILDDVSEAESALGGLIGLPSGDLTVSASTTFAAGPLVAMLPAFMQTYPQVRVKLLLVTRPVDLMADEVDISIRMGALPDSALIARRVATVPMWLCASPGYLADRPSVSDLADLGGHGILSADNGRQRLTAHDARGKPVEVIVEPALAAREPVVLHRLALGGAGIALLPWVYVGKDVASGDLVRLLPDLDMGSVPIHALYPSHRSLSAKVRVFVDALVTQLSDGGPGAFGRD